MKLRWRGVPLPPMVLLSLQNIQDYQPLNPQTQQPSHRRERSLNPHSLDQGSSSNFRSASGVTFSSRTILYSVFGPSHLAQMRSSSPDFSSA